MTVYRHSRFQRIRQPQYKPGETGREGPKATNGRVGAIRREADQDGEVQRILPDPPLSMPGAARRAASFHRIKADSVAFGILGYGDESIGSNGEFAAHDLAAIWRDACFLDGAILA